MHALKYCEQLISLNSMATHIFMYVRLLLKISFLFLFLLGSVKNSCAEQARAAEGQQSHSHIIKVSSLLPPTICNRTFPKVANKASIEVVSKYGPCSTLNKGKAISPNYTEILRKDRARLRFIQSRLSKSKNWGTGRDDDLLKQTQAITVDIIPDQSEGISGEFYSTVYLGKPRQEVSLLLDTGSQLTWTQCKPCRHCYTQAEPLFDPSKSLLTYSTLRCDSSTCTDPRQGLSPSCISKRCIYNVTYGTGHSSGILSTDRLTIKYQSGTFAKYPYIFGCGKNNYAEGLNGAAGIMGLDRSTVSFISQTSQNYFSYCYPSSYGSTGYITFGKRNDDIKNKFIKFTPIPTTPDQSQFYDIIMTGLSVGGKKFPIPSSLFRKAKAYPIIDSGTTFTSLPSSLYLTLRSAFHKQMSKYKMIKEKPGNALDTCYDLSSYDTVVIPKISFFFKGGVELELDVRGIMLVDDITSVCLAFTPNDPGDYLIILGNVQQRGIEVHHDVAGGRIGFRPGHCS